MSTDSSAALSTRCPRCGTLFTVGPDQLRAAGGWVRCGQCQEAFVAQAHALPVLHPASGGERAGPGARDAQDEAAPAAAAPVPVMPDWLAGLSLDFDDGDLLQDPPAQAARGGHPAGKASPDGAAGEPTVGCAVDVPGGEIEALPAGPADEAPQIPLLKARASQVVPEPAPLHAEAGKARGVQDAGAPRGRQMVLGIALALAAASLVAALLWLLAG